MISRALMNEKKLQVIPYKSRKGAYKILDSTSSETLYGQVVIINESNEPLKETLTFDKLERFYLVDQPAGKRSVEVNLQIN